MNRRWIRDAGTYARIAVTTYFLSQVLTGIEVGVGAAALVVLFGWSLPAALAVAIPAGFPLLLAQGGLLGWWFTALAQRSRALALEGVASPSK